jgi:DNA-binding MarR family transcriptional regulator
MPAKAEKAGIAFRYNPHLLSETELEGIFIGRAFELKELITALQTTAPDAVPQHVLLTGPRGMGKTTLLHRLALEVRNTPALIGRWLPLTFPEEQYKVSTLGELWLNVLDALADCLERLGKLAPEQMEIDRIVQRLKAMPLDEREKQALDAVKAFIARQNVGLVLLIDGSDGLFSSLENSDPDKRTTKKSGVLWRLRSVLSHQPGIFWIGTSCLPLEADNEHPYEEAFLDFFQVYELRPFSQEEMSMAMLKLAEIFGMGPNLDKTAAIEKMRQRLDEQPQRLASLHLLTNGNPRAMIVLYHLFTASDNEDIQADLDNLLDTMTPLYKSRMETLSEQPRKVFAYLMEAWNPQTAQQLGEACGLAVNAVSSQLLRLEKQNLVEKVPLSDTRRTGYQVSERFFNIWYLMRCSSRRARNRFSWLIDFMRLWFSRQESLDGVAQYRQRLASGEYREKDFVNAALYVRAQDNDPEARVPGRDMFRLNEAKATYRESVRLSAANAQEEAHILLQAHLFLENRDAALSALETLSRHAFEKNSAYAFSRIKEQLRECHAIGKGAELADLMEQSAYAERLQPYSLALRAAVSGTTRVFRDAPQEIVNMADEVYREVFAEKESAKPTELSPRQSR